MSPEEIKAKLRSCLALQSEIAAKTDELTDRYKQVLLAWDHLKEREQLRVEIDGEVYQLKRKDFETEDAIESPGNKAASTVSIGLSRSANQFDWKAVFQCCNNFICSVFTAIPA